MKKRDKAVMNVSGQLLSVMRALRTGPLKAATTLIDDMITRYPLVAGGVLAEALDLVVHLYACGLEDTAIREIDHLDELFGHLGTAGYRPITTEIIAPSTPPQHRATSICT